MTIRQMELTLHAFCHLVDLLDRTEKPSPQSIILLRRQFCAITHVMEWVLRDCASVERSRIPYFGKFEGEHVDLPPESWVSI